MSAALLLLLAAAPAAGQNAVPGKSTATVVGAIRVERLNVFDPNVPGEGWWPFRVANRIHIQTRENIIRRELLFREGEIWDELKVIESERNLRANGSFRRVDIARDKDGVAVRTQDSWTTNPKLSFGTEGGRTFYSYGLEENNILGYGKSIGVAHNEDGDTRSNSVLYGDPRFLGTRLRLGGAYTDSSDGDAGSAFLTRPFYSLDSDNAVSASWSRSLGDGDIVRDGQTYSEFRVRRRYTEASIGQRLNDDRLFVNRFEMGWYSERRQYEAAANTNGPLPADQEMSGPTVGWSWVMPRYVKETYVDRMEHVEDFNLGNEFSLRGGWLPQAAGSDRDRSIFYARDQQGLSLGPGRFALAALTISGRTHADHWENASLSAAGNVIWKSGWVGDQTWVAHFEGVTGRYLDRDSQVTLGGGSGLRGYKNDAFVGGKALLMNLENRFFLPGEYLHLMRFGGVVFFDSGVVAHEGSGFAPERLKSDIGFGMRVGSTRSRGGAVGRVDLAYALNSGPGGSRWVLTVQAGQAFDLFNSAARRVRQSPGSRLQ